MIRALVECWELPLGRRAEAERGGLRLAAAQRATGVTLPGSPVDRVPAGSLLWRRCVSLHEGQGWLDGEKAPPAPWADRATLARVPAGYVYEDPDVPGLWFATRRPCADPCARDAGPFASRHAACVSLVGGRQAAGTSRGRGAERTRADRPGDDRGPVRERAHEAMVRAPLPGELLDEARTAKEGTAALLRAWPEAARLSLDPAARRQAIGRVSLLPELEELDPDAAEQEAAVVIDMLTRLLRRCVDDQAGQAEPRHGGRGHTREKWTRSLRRLAGRPMAKPVPAAVGSAPTLAPDDLQAFETGFRGPDHDPAAGSGETLTTLELVAAFGDGRPGHDDPTTEPARRPEAPGPGDSHAGAVPPVVGQQARRGWYQLEERHLALQIGRLAAVAGAGAATLLWFEPLLADRADVLTVSVAAFAAHLAVLLVPLRWPRRLRLAVDVSLIVDAAWIAGVALSSGGSRSPLLGLFLLAALTSTLGYSGRTGIKAAILASLGYLALVWHDEGQMWTQTSATRLLALWGIVGIAAAGAAIGQRELHRRAERLGVLQEAGSNLLSISNPAALEEVARSAAERLLPGWQVSTRRGQAPEAVRLMRDETEALVAVPVTNGSTAIGVIECRRPRRAGRSATSVRARDLACLRDLGAALGVALSRAELIDALSRASATDPLTGLANRRSFDAGLARELAGIRRHGRPVSLCLLDVDHFKRYNDTHGHLAGDQALVLVASVLRSELRGLDLAARYGGEEFVLLLPDTDLDAAAGVAERIRSAVADLPAPGSPLTVSIGVAAATEGCFPDALIATADEALYAAKEGGRNRVETADSPPAASA